MNAKTLEAITKHGKTLLAAFPNAIEKDPVALCKKLRRIETAVSRVTTDYCNGTASENACDAACESAINRTAKLLGLDKAGVKFAGLFVNRDPRGYALKLDGDASSWFKNWQSDSLKSGTPRIHQDWGGYGILAPDLNN